MEQVIDGLAPEGELLLVGAPQEPLELQVGPLLDNRWSVKGWSAGHPGDARDTLELAAERDIEPRIETYSLGETETAVRRLLEGEARFRTVVEP
jgi:D-arabinose 1-dehydrogenase-like Zn-dependent alcohol dehydrogenase